MMTVHKTITLTEAQAAWIAAEVASGRYSDDSEAIRNALVEGERSGTPEPFDFAAFKRRKSAQYA